MHKDECAKSQKYEVINALRLTVPTREIDEHFIKNINFKST